jgi:hypothetical protein
MSESRWRRMPVLLAMPAAAAVALGLAGCGSSPSHSAGASAAKPAGVTAQTVAFSAAKLRGALLTKVNGATPAAPAAAGTYSTLPGLKQSKQAGITVNPKACAGDSALGFDTSAVQSAPAAVATFKVGGNGVSEVLLAPSAAAAAAAMDRKLPAECAHYTATVSGQTYDYSVTDASVSGIGQQARLINVQTAGYPSDDVWTVLYRGTGFLGAITVIGPDSSQAAVRELGAEAYDYAAKALS